MTPGKRIALSVLAVAGLVLTACGSDSDSSANTTAAPATEETEAAAETTVAATEDTEAAADTTEVVAEAAAGLDYNGDGKVVMGVAAAGPRDDGAYYQALVDKIESFSSDNGYETPIVVDNITAEDAATELGNLAEQGVDAIFVGASEIADPLADLVAQYPDIFWYCNCGAGYPATEGLAQSQDDSSEISYSAGYATGLLIQAKGAPGVAAFLGCCDLPFEKEAYLAYELGLKAVDASYSVSYIPTGSFQFDFDNTAGATEAFNAASAGIGAVYPYLGGAHEPIVKLANENDIITMSAGSSKACDRTDLTYDIQVAFDAGDYVDTLLKELEAGTFAEGDIRVFHVGVDPEPGAKICQATPEQQTAMDDVYAQIAAGDLAGDFGAIKGQAYSG